MIIRWIKNLQEASDARAVAQKELDKQSLSVDQEKRLAAEISKQNKQIETYAKRINEDLKRAASERNKIESPLALESIKDSQLKDYCSSVSRTIDNLNKQIEAEGWRADQYLLSVNNKRLEAVKLQKTATKNVETLARELTKVEKREEDAAKRLKQRDDEIRKIKAEQKRLENERKKLDSERMRVKDTETQKRRQLEQLRKEREGLDVAIKREPKRDERDLLRDKAARLDPQIEQLQQLVERHLRFQLDQLTQIQAKIDFEDRQLDSGLQAGEADAKQIKGEIEDLKKAKAGVKANMAKEQKRADALAAVVVDCDRARERAKEYGVGARS